jgi:hypothetical protein
MHLTVHHKHPYGPQTAVSSVPPCFPGSLQHRRLGVLRRRQRDTVCVKCSQPNVTRSATRMVSSYGPKMAVSSAQPRLPREPRYRRLEVSRLKTESNTLLVGALDRGTNLYSPCTVTTAPSTPTRPLERPRSSRSERANPCQDGTVIRKRSNTNVRMRSVRNQEPRKFTRRFNTVCVRRSNTNVNPRTKTRARAPDKRDRRKKGNKKFEAHIAPRAWPLDGVEYHPQGNYVRAEPCQDGTVI